MKVLVIGSGGREHALVRTLRNSPSVDEVLCLPGNPGISGEARLLSGSAGDLKAIRQAAQKEKPDLVVVGPEAPLVDGLADILREDGFSVFGVGKQGAQLEASKAFAKDFMVKAGIPTALHKTFTDSEKAFAFAKELGPCVVKADGLAAGKGVVVCENLSETKKAIDDCLIGGRFGESGSTVIVEERLEGEEISIFAISDGNRYVLLSPAQDHKRLSDNDQGPNTGGMGAYAPTPLISSAEIQDVRKNVLDPVLEGMKKAGQPYIGVLYVGLILTSDGPKVIEFNVRFGDPEAQVVLPLVDEDLALLLSKAANGTLNQTEVRMKDGYYACVVLAAPGYPDHPKKGLELDLWSWTDNKDLQLFQAGTEIKNKILMTAGGRVLSIVGYGQRLEDAVEKAYVGVDRAKFPGCQYRRDIGQKALRKAV